MSDRSQTAVASAAEVQPSRPRGAPLMLLAIICIASLAPFAGKAYHIDDTLFLKLAQVGLIAPSNVGITALNDVGRVFVTGQQSSAWHDGYGGGFWASFQNRRYLVTLTIAHSVERTVLYGGLGLGW